MREILSAIYDYPGVAVGVGVWVVLLVAIFSSCIEDGLKGLGGKK